MQGSSAPIVGVASLPLPHAQQVALVALDSQGVLHLFTTPVSTNVVVWEEQAAGSAAELTGASQQGMLATALGASRGSEASQEGGEATDTARVGMFASRC